METQKYFTMPKKKKKNLHKKNPLKQTKQGVCHTMALPFIYITKYILRQKEEELWKFNNISPCKNIIYNLHKKKSF